YAGALCISGVHNEVLFKLKIAKRAEDNPRDGPNANPPGRRSRAGWRYPKDEKRFHSLLAPLAAWWYY
ncbi:MAG: hypothetical protein ACYC38_02405, partial [Eubacteriales bacterium]